MGMGFQNKKKTAKALESDITQLENKVRNALMMLQVQLSQINQRVVTVEQQAELLDFRSLATLKLTAAKGLFTNAEHDAMAELVRIEAFNEQSDRDNTARYLKPTTEGLDKGLVYVARVDAYEPAQLVTPAVEATDTTPAVEAKIEPNPNAGKKIDQLSMLRMKVAYGSGEFPGVFEEHFKGAKTNDLVGFSIECPKELGPFAGKTVDFKVSVIQVLKSEPPPVPVELVEDDEPVDTGVSAEKPN